MSAFAARPEPVEGQDAGASELRGRREADGANVPRELDYVERVALSRRVALRDESSHGLPTQPRRLKVLRIRRSSTDATARDSRPLRLRLDDLLRRPSRAGDH